MSEKCYRSARYRADYDTEIGSECHFNSDKHKEDNAVANNASSCQGKNRISKSFNSTRMEMAFWRYFLKIK